MFKVLNLLVVLFGLVYAVSTASTIVPSKAPTAKPTTTAPPTISPTAKPTIIPTASPTALPTLSPTAVPSVLPTIPPSTVPTIIPTATPTTAFPTAVPTTAIPTRAPTYAVNEMGQMTCVPFSAANTASATTNTVDCKIIACHGQTVRASVCASETNGFGACSDDTYLRVVDAAGTEIASNDDYCGFCSSLSFVATQQCTTYTIKQGCYYTASCSGTTAVLFFA